ncbi:unnamed protein product [Paramecium sonneborni]|uniref:Uncharacterized protein n=1 Tax=Paramecium sonneborni TaxID=65129 RepID=A0A8S1N8A8_9CILI|nr:unnamed protein product [Paramecium sonneborni]
MNIFDKQKCCVCSKGLQILLMRFSSYCKKCHQSVCMSCSTNRIKLYSIPNEMVQDFDKPQRVCDNCYKDYLYYQDLITKYNLQWNTKSLFFNILLGEKKRKIKIQQPLELNEKQNIEKDILTGRSDAHLLNYSIREFVTQCQQGQTLQQIRSSIIRVLELFIVHHPTIGYCQGMSFIATICLCLSDEEGAFHIMNHLFSVIIPFRFFSSSSGASLIGYQAEINFIKEMILVNDFQEKTKLVKFVELQGPQFLLTLMIQVLNISSLLVTWKEMFKIKSFIPIDKAVLYTLKTAVIKNVDLMSSKPLNILGKFVYYTNLIEIFQNENIYFTKFERIIYIEQFYSKTSRSWVSNDSNILNKLKNISNFEVDEIASLQIEFKKNCLDQKIVQINQQQRQSIKQLAQLTDSSDEEDDEYRQQLIIQQFKLQKYGINFETFIYYMDIFQQKEISDSPLDQEQFKLVFNLFDENKSELLDFREFLICLSILLRGSFAEKFKMFFTAHTSTVLQFYEFQALLSLLIPQQIQITQEYKQFLQRIKRSQFNYFDMLNVLKDPFLIKIEDLKQQQKQQIQKLNTYNRFING